MKSFLTLFIIGLTINLTASTVSSDDATLHSNGFVRQQPMMTTINTREYFTLPQSEIFLMKIFQRISTASILPEQKTKANAIFEMAKENFQKCENEYSINSHNVLYKNCLGTYMRLAMAQIRALELDNRSVMLTGIPTTMFRSNMITSSAARGMTTRMNQNYVDDDGMTKSKSNNDSHNSSSGTSNSNHNNNRNDDIENDEVIDSTGNLWRMIKQNERVPTDSREHHLSNSL